MASSEVNLLHRSEYNFGKIRNENIFNKLEPGLPFLIQCSVCNRRFLPASFNKHRRRCKNVDNKENNDRKETVNKSQNVLEKKLINAMISVEEMSKRRRERQMLWRIRHNSYMNAIHSLKDNENTNNEESQIENRFKNQRSTFKEKNTSHDYNHLHYMDSKYHENNNLLRSSSCQSLNNVTTLSQFENPLSIILLNENIESDKENKMCNTKCDKKDITYKRILSRFYKIIPKRKILSDKCTMEFKSEILFNKKLSDEDNKSLIYSRKYSVYERKPSEDIASKRSGRSMNGKRFVSCGNLSRSTSAMSRYDTNMNKSHRKCKYLSSCGDIKICNHKPFSCGKPSYDVLDCENESSKLHVKSNKKNYIDTRLENNNKTNIKYYRNSERKFDQDIHWSKTWDRDKRFQNRQNNRTQVSSEHPHLTDIDESVNSEREANITKNKHLMKTNLNDGYDESIIRPNAMQRIYSNDMELLQKKKRESYNTDIIAPIPKIRNEIKIQFRQKVEAIPLINKEATSEHFTQSMNVNNVKSACLRSINNLEMNVSKIPYCNNSITSNFHTEQTNETTFSNNSDTFITTLNTLNLRSDKESIPQTHIKCYKSDVNYNTLDKRRHKSITSSLIPTTCDSPVFRSSISLLDSLNSLECNKNRFTTSKKSNSYCHNCNQTFSTSIARFCCFCGFKRL